MIFENRIIQLRREIITDHLADILNTTNGLRGVLNSSADGNSEPTILFHHMWSF